MVVEIYFAAADAQGNVRFKFRLMGRDMIKVAEGPCADLLDDNARVLEIKVRVTLPPNYLAPVQEVA